MLFKKHYSFLLITMLFLLFGCSNKEGGLRLETTLKEVSIDGVMTPVTGKVLNFPPKEIVVEVLGDFVKKDGFSFYRTYKKKIKIESGVETILKIKDSDFTLTPTKTMAINTTKALYDFSNRVKMENPLGVYINPNSPLETMIFNGKNIIFKNVKNGKIFREFDGLIFDVNKTLPFIGYGDKSYVSFDVEKADTDAIGFTCLKIFNNKDINETYCKANKSSNAAEALDPVKGLIKASVYNGDITHPIPKSEYDIEKDYGYYKDTGNGLIYNAGEQTLILKMFCDINHYEQPTKIYHINTYSVPGQQVEIFFDINKSEPYDFELGDADIQEVDAFMEKFKSKKYYSYNDRQKVETTNKNFYATIDSEEKYIRFTDAFSDEKSPYKKWYYPKWIRGKSYAFLSSKGKNPQMRIINSFKFFKDRGTKKECFTFRYELEDFERIFCAEK